MSAAADRPPGRRTDAPRPPGDRGFALVAALWILVLVGAVSAAFLAAAQSQRRTVANAAESARARWAARAGLARATATLDRQLAGSGAARALRAAGDSLLRSEPLRVNGVPVVATLLDSRARVHLNRATRRELVDLLTALGVGRGRAQRLTAAVLDWRDPDTRRRPGGAERRDYAALGLPVRPRDGPFPSVGELKQVRGFAGRLFGRVRPYLTVIGDGRVNVNSAPAPVLAVLPVLDPEAGRVLVERRRGDPFSSAFQVARALPDETARRLRRRMDAFEERAAFGPRYGQLLVRADVPGAPASVTLHAVVELQGGQSWRTTRVWED